MYVNLLIAALAAICTTASAAVIPRQEEGEIPEIALPELQVTNFIWGSSPGGTAGSLNLTAEADYFPGAPGFDVVCYPIMVQRGWTPCRTPEGGDLPPENRVDIIWPASEEQGRFVFGAAHIFQIAEGGSWVNATAMTDIEVPEPREPASFEIPLAYFAVSGEEPESPEE